MPIDPTKLQVPPAAPGLLDTVRKGLDVADQPLTNHMPAVKAALDKLYQPSPKEAPGVKQVHTPGKTGVTATADEGDRSGLLGMLKDVYHHPEAAFGGAVEGATKPTTIANAIGTGGMVGASRAALEAPELLSAGKTLGLFPKAPGAVTQAATRVIPSISPTLGRAAGAVNVASGLHQATDPNAGVGQELMGGMNAVLGAGEMMMPTGMSVPKPNAPTAQPSIFNTAEEFTRAAEGPNGLHPDAWPHVQAKMAEEKAAEAVTGKPGPFTKAVSDYTANVEARALRAEALGDTKTAQAIRKQAVDLGIANPTTSRAIIRANKVVADNQDNLQHTVESAVRGLAVKPRLVPSKGQTPAGLPPVADVDKSIGQVDKEVAARSAEVRATEAATLKAEQDAAEKAAAQAKIDAAKARLGDDVVEQESVGQTTAVKNGGTTERLNTRFVQKPPEDPTGGAGAGGATPSGGGPISGTLRQPNSPVPTQYGSWKEAHRMEAKMGALTSVKNPNGPGWVHVFEADKPPTAAPTAPTGSAAPLAKAERPADPAFEAYLDKQRATRGSQEDVPDNPDARRFEMERLQSQGLEVPEWLHAKSIEDAANAPIPAEAATPPPADMGDIEAAANAPIPPPEEPPVQEPPAAAPVVPKKPKGPKGGKPAGSSQATPSPAAPPAGGGEAPPPAPSPVPERVVEKPVVQPDLNPPNLSKAAPTDDINDVDLATGVATSKQIKVPKDQFATAEEAGAAAKAAGLPEHAIDQFGKSFRVAGPRPYHEIVPGPGYADTPRGISQPEGIVLSNTKGGAWDRAPFEPKGEAPVEEPTPTPVAEPTPPPAAEPDKTTTAEPPTQASPPKAQFRVGKGPGVKEVSPEELDAMSDKERYDYFKKVGPVQAATFPFRHGLKLPPDIEADWKALADSSTRMKKTDIYAELSKLWQRSRGAALAEEQKPNAYPAIGSPRWHDVHNQYGNPQSAPAEEVARAEGEGLPPLVDRLKSEKGSAMVGDPALLARALAAGIGGYYGGKNDPIGAMTGGHHQLLSGALAAGGIMAVPAITKAFAGGGVPAIAGVQKTVKGFGENLNAIHNAGLLSPLSVVKKATADVGGLTSAAIENPERAGNIIRTLMNPRALGRAYDAGKAAFHLPSEEMTGSEQLLNKTPLSWAGKTMGALTAGTKHVLGEAGFDPLEQGYYTMTSKPITAVGGGVYGIINKNNLLKNISPFARIGINRMERGFERSPLGFINLMREGLTPEQAQQVVSRAMLGSVGTEAVYEATPENFVKEHPVEASVLSALAGPYGLPTALAMAAKTRNASGGMTAAAKTLQRDIPGFELFQMAGSPRDLPSSYLSGYTNVAKPLADMVEPEDKVITTSPRYNVAQNATYKALSNIPGMRSKLPHHTISVKPLSAEEIQALQDYLSQAPNQGQQ